MIHAVEDDHISHHSRCAWTHFIFATMLPSW